jgi:hypothetical protein
MDVTDIQTCESVEVRSLAVEEESKLALRLQRFRKCVNNESVEYSDTVV